MQNNIAQASRRTITGLATIGVAVGVAAGGVAGAAPAAPANPYVEGDGRAQVGREHVRLEIESHRGPHHPAGTQDRWSLAYYDGDGWLVATHPCPLKVTGRVAKLRGQGRWRGRQVYFHVQVKDRTPKRMDAISIKVKDGKRVVVRQSATLTSGNFVVHS